MGVRLVLWFLATIGLGLPAAAYSPTVLDHPVAVQAPTAEYDAVTVDCPIEVPEQPAVTCGVLTVPEDHDEPGGPTVRLPYLILHSPASDPEPDPVVYTSGGPGYSALDSVWGFAQSPLLDTRDIVIAEQRGNRYSQPALRCDLSVWSDIAPGVTPCLDSIRSRGIDLSTYTTDSMVRDLIALRQALGYEQWNLYGTSFSTSLMLLLMEADPGGTRSAILLSVKPPSETTFAHEADSPLQAIEQLLRACDDDEECRGEFPDLEDQLFTVIERLNREPLEFELQLAGGDETIPIEMDGDHFIDWIVINQLYGPVFPPFGAAYLPLLISEVHDGNTTPLQGAAEGFWNDWLGDPNWSWGLLLAVNCQQDLPAAGDERTAADLAASERLDGFFRSSGQRDICAAWNLEPQPPAGETYLQSDIAALILAGAFDPVNPPIWGRTAAEHLTNASFVQFPGHGHNVSVDNPCVAALEAAFVDDPGADLETGCVTSAPTPEFVTPGDIYRTSTLARSGREVSLGDPAGVGWLEALTAVGVYGMALLMAGLLVGGAVWLGRQVLGNRATVTGSRVDRTAAAGYGVALAVILASLAIPILVTEINNTYPNPNQIDFLFGPSRDLLAATLVAWLTPIAAILVVVLAAVTIWAWIDGRWGVVLRIGSTMVVLAALPMMYLGYRWGLFTMLW